MQEISTVRIQYHYEPEGWWAESPDVPGFTAAGASFPEVRSQVREGWASFWMLRR